MTRQTACTLSEGRKSLSPARLEIARQLLGWRTLYELASSLGRESGSIRQTVHRMVADGVLESDDPGLGKGTSFRLSAAYQDELGDPEPSGSELGLLADGQRLLFVDHGGDVGGFLDVVGDHATGGVIAWTIEFSDTARLVSVEAGASQIGVDRLLRAFGDAEFLAKGGRLGAPTPAEASRRATREVAAR